MTNSRDPFDILNDYDPVDHTSIPDADSPRGRALLQQITQSGRPRRAVRPRVVLAVAIIAAIAAAGMTWYILTRDVTQLGISCHAAVTTDSDIVAVSADGTPAAIDCASAWADGLLTNPDVLLGDVPPLTACVTDVGAVVVFPTADSNVCDSLGLAHQNPNQPSDNLEKLAAAEQEITDYILATTCQPLDEAETVIKGILDAHGLADWTVTRQPNHPDRPCASVAYDTERKLVVLVPNPPAP